jgi:hypothetical protein
MRKRRVKGPESTRITMRRNGNGLRSAVLRGYLRSYRDLREVRFPNARQHHKALDLLDSDDLRNVPYDLTGGGIVVPSEAVRFFETIGKFTEKKIAY